MNVGYDSCPKEAGQLLHRMLGCVLPLNKMSDHIKSGEKAGI